MKPLVFNELKRNLKRDYTGLKKIKIAVVADNSSQLLTQALKGYAFEYKINVNIYEADYNQLDLQILDFSSQLYEFEPDYIFINKSSEHLLKDFYGLNKDDQLNFAEENVNIIKNYVAKISERLKSKVIINTLPEINDAVFGNFASKVNFSFVYQLRRLNLLLMDESRLLKQLFICDIASLQSAFGHNFSFDPKLYVNGDMVYSIDFLPQIAKSVLDVISAIEGSFKKCVILDLDNTLWGGVIGDDGIENIQIGDLGIGKAYVELQRWIKQLIKRGIIAAVCSKNTEEIAKEPFEKHPDMVLGLKDIAVFVANWETKVDNIRYIQGILNIGFDSMVFIDDNPFEREMVKGAIGDITVPDLPEDPVEYLPFLRSLNLFETASFTEEDEQRTELYQQEAKRAILERSFENEEEFLLNLEMESDVKPFDNFTIPRVAQLTQRSNQFNLRTVRYTESDIKRIRGSEEYRTLSFTLEDKFGSHGLISAIILKKDEDSLFVDTWIMSCRVLKRGMERFTINCIVEVAKQLQVGKITGEYLPTKKNVIVKDHYRDLGFEFAEKRWVLDINNFENEKTFIKQKMG